MAAEMRAYVIDVGEAITAYRSYQFPAPRNAKTGRNGLINPPLDLDRLAEFYNESTWHRNAVRVKSRDQVGHGWTLTREFAEDEEPPGAQGEWELLDNFFWNGAVEGFTDAAESRAAGAAVPVPQRGDGTSADRPGHHRERLSGGGPGGPGRGLATLVRPGPGVEDEAPQGPGAVTLAGGAEQRPVVQTVRPGGKCPCEDRRDSPYRHSAGPG